MSILGSYDAPGVPVEPDIFLSDLDQLLVDVDADHPGGFVVLGNAGGTSRIR